jgi:dUTPase
MKTCENTVIPPHITVKKLPARAALNAYPRRGGGVCGGITGGNSLGIVPAAFQSETFNHTRYEVS